MDARALHPGVFEAAGEALGGLVREGLVREGLVRGRTLRALEVGGGAGGAFPRWMELLAPFSRVEFTACDRDEELLRAYRTEVLSWAGEVPERLEDTLHLAGGKRTLDVHFHCAAAPDGIRDFEDGGLDLLAAQSFWDLVPPGTALPMARRLLAPGGVFYAALTFSGATRFDPPDPADGHVLDCYHRSMDRSGGDRRAGERLIEEFRAPGSGFSVLAAGRSDWKVVPEGANYPADERFFLETLLGFVEKELAADPESVPEPNRHRWLDTRRAQLQEGRLSFTARQHDLAAQRTGDGGVSVRR